MGRIQALPGSTFSSVAARGAYDAEAQAVLTFREFERILTLEVLGSYHNEIHAALARTPASAWADGASSVTLRDGADAAGLLRDFLPFEERIVCRDGIRLFNILYQDGALAHLVDHGVGKLRVKYDPRDLSAVFVELPAGEHVRVPYADLGRLPITLWEHREVTRRLRTEGRRSVDQRPFKLGDGAQHLQREHALGCGGVDRIAQAAEMRPRFLELFDHGQQVADRARQPIEPDHYQGFAGADFVQQARQHRSAAIGAGGVLFEDRGATGGAQCRSAFAISVGAFSASVTD